MRVRDLYAAGVAGAEAELARRERERRGAQDALDAIPDPGVPVVGPARSAESLWTEARWEHLNARRRADGRDEVRRHDLGVREATDGLTAARRRLEMVDRVLERRAKAVRRLRSRREAARLEDDWRARRD